MKNNTTDNDIILEARDISLYYGSIRALRNVNINIKKGEIVTLVGPNGAGKSSLINAIANINEKKGKINFKGKNISDFSSEKIVKEGISIIPEGHLIFSSLTVLENLQLGLFQGRERGSLDLQKIYSYFPVLQKRKEQKAGTLSGGEQQMLSIGRALLSNPELLLIDEPSLGLAPKVVNDIFNILKKLNKEGFTILLSEQNVKKAFAIADRGYLLKTGQIVKEGKIEDIKNEISNLYLE